MCGILCWLRSEINENGVSKNEQQRKRDVLLEINEPEEVGRLYIDSEKRMSVRLSKKDENKLKYLSQLRTLDERLVNLRNTVKKDPETELACIEIEEKIRALVEDDGGGDERQTEERAGNDKLGPLIERIACRGPDYLKHVAWEYGGHRVEAVSSVLSLRHFQAQPLEKNDFVLQFNGELYNEESVDVNDTNLIMEWVSSSRCSESREDAVLRTVARLKGEFSFSIFDLQEEKLYFGRDCIGRRSLLYCFNEEQKEMVLSSSASSSARLFANFTECANEVMVYDYRNISIRKISYQDLWAKYDTTSGLQLNPKTGLFDFQRSYEDRIANLEKHLLDSCRLRLEALHPLRGITGKDALINVLFSGGLDCTLLVAMICKNMDSHANCNIDLTTVGFDSPRVDSLACSSPDVMLSKKSWFHLSKLFQNKQVSLRLVEVQVSYRDWLLHKNRVRSLIYPRNTEMDLSIGAAFYFAGRCTGGNLITLKDFDVTWEEFLKNEDSYINRESNYDSKAEVLLSGLGADELFAGYSRHHSIFHGLNLHESQRYQQQVVERYKKLTESLLHDVSIIHERNLGRDDRVVSVWGKELRYPYLDENLINYVVNEIEPNLKLYFKLQYVHSKKQKEEKLTLVPTKKFILRELASRLNLHWVKDEPKRAIQFGSRSAKMDIWHRKTKGTDSI